MEQRNGCIDPALIVSWVEKLLLPEPSDPWSWAPSDLILSIRTDNHIPSNQPHSLDIEKNSLSATNNNFDKSSPSSHNMSQKKAAVLTTKRIASKRKGLSKDKKRRSVKAITENNTEDTIVVQPLFIQTPELTIDATTDIPPMEKRKRGRPRKTQSFGAESYTAFDRAVQASGKRPRGRPRKAKVQQTSNEEAIMVQSAAQQTRSFQGSSVPSSPDSSFRIALTQINIIKSNQQQTHPSECERPFPSPSHSSNMIESKVPEHMSTCCQSHQRSQPAHQFDQITMMPEHPTPIPEQAQSNRQHSNIVQQAAIINKHFHHPVVQPVMMQETHIADPGQIHSWNPTPYQQARNNNQISPHAMSHWNSPNNPAQIFHPPNSHDGEWYAPLQSPIVPTNKSAQAYYPQAISQLFEEQYGRPNHVPLDTAAYPDPSYHDFSPYRQLNSHSSYSYSNER